MSDITIEPLTKERVKEAIEVAVRAFGEKSRYDAEIDFPTSVSENYPRPYQTFIALKNDKVIGAVQCVHGNLSADIYNILWVCVDPSFQNQGVGQAVLAQTCAHIETKLLKGGKGTILLVSDINPDYYKKAGFSSDNKTHANGTIMTKILKGK